MFRNKARISLIVLAVAVLFAAAWAYTRSGKSAPSCEAAAKSPARVVSVELVEVSRGELKESLTLAGALKPKEQVDIAPKVPGRVQSITVHVGDTVRRGAVIAVFEDDELKQQVQRAAAALSVAHAGVAQRKAEFQNAQAELKRASSLRDEGLISAQDFATSQTTSAVVRAQMDLAEAQQQQAQAELRELNIRLEQLRITSPITGVVANRYVDVGALVSPTTPVVRVVNLSTMVTAATLPERELGKLRPGDTASVRVDAYGDEVFRGRVARIGPVLDPATRSATIEIEVPNPGQRLKAEMFARVELDLASTRQAVLIPRDALVYRGKQPGVFLAQENTPVFTPVETGQTAGGQVEVVANLEPGTRIVGRGAAMIREGDQIAPAGKAQSAANDPARAAAGVVR
ncbi:MAG TPA: efflux RND transporter periplasmic adaptor subunit [Bryobacteraceae bacterium]|nr:efflux RND transporter periplasmic adaptor subunit [Bryobacteraceae bacterium]